MGRIAQLGARAVVAPQLELWWLALVEPGAITQLLGAIAQLLGTVAQLVLRAVAELVLVVGQLAFVVLELVVAQLVVVVVERWLARRPSPLAHVLVETVLVVGGSSSPAPSSNRRQDVHRDDRRHRHDW